MKKVFLLVLPASLLFAPAGSCQLPGTKLWQVTAPEEIVSSPAIGPDGTIYVGTGNLEYAGSICSFSPQGGTNWVLRCPRVVISSPGIGADGRIYVGCYNGDLKIIRPDGSYTNARIGGYIVSSPAIGSDGTVYIGSISNTFNRLVALTAEGSLKWVFNMHQPLSAVPHSYAHSCPAIGPDGTVYVGSIDHNLYAINPDGTTNWVFPLASMTNSITSPTYASPSIGSDGTIYIGADNGVFYAIRADGALKWRFQASDIVESSAAVGLDGTIYFGSIANGQFYALAADGSEKWSFLSGGVTASPALGSDGSILVGSYANMRLYALDSAGSTLWSFATPDYIWSSPAVAADGTVYVASGTKLYALYGTNTLMNSSWPLFRGNVKHTARSIQRGIGNAGVLPDGSFRMALNVETGRTYEVEYSTNLLIWSRLTNFVSNIFTNQVIDARPTNSSQRFYRLSTPPE